MFLGLFIPTHLLHYNIFYNWHCNKLVQCINKNKKNPRTPEIHYTMHYSLQGILNFSIQLLTSSQLTAITTTPRPQISNLSLHMHVSHNPTSNISNLSLHMHMWEQWSIRIYADVLTSSCVFEIIAYKSSCVKWGDSGNKTAVMKTTTHPVWARKWEGGC